MRVDQGLAAQGQVLRRQPVFWGVPGLLRETIQGVAQLGGDRFAPSLCVRLEDRFGRECGVVDGLRQNCVHLR